MDIVHHKILINPMLALLMFVHESTLHSDEMERYMHPGLRPQGVRAETVPVGAEGEETLDV